MGGRRFAALALGLLSCAALAGCATRPFEPSVPRAAPPPVEPSAPPEAPPRAMAFAALPGWDAEDFAAALAAFASACEHVRRVEFTAACAQARALTPADEAAGRAFSSEPSDPSRPPARAC